MRTSMIRYVIAGRKPLFSAPHDTPCLYQGKRTARRSWNRDIFLHLTIALMLCYLRDSSPKLLPPRSMYQVDGRRWCVFPEHGHVPGRDILPFRSGGDYPPTLPSAQTQRPSVKHFKTCRLWNEYIGSRRCCISSDVRRIRYP